MKNYFLALMLLALGSCQKEKIDTSTYMTFDANGVHYDYSRNLVERSTNDTLIRTGYAVSGISSDSIRLAFSAYGLLNWNTDFRIQLTLNGVVYMSGSFKDSTNHYVNSNLMWHGELDQKNGDYILGTYSGTLYPVSVIADSIIGPSLVLSNGSYRVKKI